MIGHSRISELLNNSRSIVMYLIRRCGLRLLLAYRISYVWAIQIIVLTIHDVITRLALLELNRFVIDPVHTVGTKKPRQ